MGILKKYWKWLLGVVLVIGIGAFFLLKPDLKNEQQELEVQVAVDTTNYSRDTVETDWVLAQDSAKPSTVKAVKKERASAVRVIKTQQKQVANLKKQLKPTFLSLFAELDYDVPRSEPILEGNSAFKVGAQVQIRKGTIIKGYVAEPLTGEGERVYGVGVRQEFKLF